MQRDGKDERDLETRSKNLECLTLLLRLPGRENKQNIRQAVVRCIIAEIFLGLVKA